MRGFAVELLFGGNTEHGYFIADAVSRLIGRNASIGDSPYVTQSNSSFLSAAQFLSFKPSAITRRLPMTS